MWTFRVFILSLWNQHNILFVLIPNMTYLKKFHLSEGPFFQIFLHKNKFS